MAQPNFKDPFVSSGPTFVGTGNGSLTVDRLTHFTTTQTYTFTCISTSPDAVFSVSGSLDGPVGLATVGTQFFDADLKIFATIQQGSTLFVVGDQFTLTATHGTDLNQDNIDDYDEQPQKNFGTGVKGTLSGDHSIRFDDSEPFARLYLQDLKYLAVADGDAGDDVQVQYLAPVAATFASLLVQDITYTAVTAGAAGNAISITYVGDAIAGAESVGVIGNAITVHLQSGVSTATQVKAAFDLVPAATALASAVITGTPSNPQTAPFGPTSLGGGTDGLGSITPSVVVVGNLIKVYLQSGVHTAQQVKTAYDLVGAATALASLSIVGLAGESQTSPVAITNLSGGKDRYFTLNQRELTEAGDFQEGNAALLAATVDVQGDMSVNGTAAMDGELALLNPAYDPVPSAQRALTNLRKQSWQDRSLRLVKGGAWSWDLGSSTLTWAEDAYVNAAGTASARNTVVAASKTLSDGQVLYVSINRTAGATANLTVNTALLSALAQNDNTFIIAERVGSVVYVGSTLLLEDGDSFQLGAGGGGSGDVHVQLYDSADTSLPTGPTATIDGVSVANDMYVLFTNLSVGNNRVYKASGVGSSISWAVQNVFSAGVAPSIGESVIVEQGTSFGLQRGLYDGSTFKFNETVRHFVGLNYWEQSGLQTSAIADNTTADVFSLAITGSENIIVDFSLLRGVAKEVGTLHITSDGTNVSLDAVGTYLAVSGITFSAFISSGTLHVQYTSTSTGVSGSMKYSLKRWSDAAGGPAGPPSYSAGPVAPVTAAGVSGSVQYNAAGSLGGDTSFLWDSTNKILKLNTLEIFGLVGPLTLLDNQTDATLITYDASDYPFVIIEFSIVRDGKYRLGRMLITNDGTNVAFSDDSVLTGDAGVTLSAIISGSNVLIRYTTTSIGLSGNFKYSARRWA